MHYVIVEVGDQATILGLDGYDHPGAKRAISWQRQGQFREPMHICTYNAVDKAFVAEDTGQTFRPINMSFTAQAWDAFLQRLDPEVAANGGFEPSTPPAP